MKNKGLDLETLKYIKVHFEFYGIAKSEPLGYEFVCDTIERLETPDETLAEIRNEILKIKSK